MSETNQPPDRNSGDVVTTVRRSDPSDNDVKRTLIGVPVSAVTSSRPAPVYSSSALVAVAPDAVRRRLDNRVVPSTLSTTSIANTSMGPGGLISPPQSGASSALLPRRLDVGQHHRKASSIDQRQWISELVGQSHKSWRHWYLVWAAVASVLVTVGVTWLVSNQKTGVKLRLLHTPTGDYAEVIATDRRIVSVEIFGERWRLHQGRTRIPLTYPTVKPGKHQTMMTLLGERGVLRQVRVPMDLDFLIALNTKGAGGKPPTFTLQLYAKPHSRAWIEHEPLALDAKGYGSRSYPIRMLDKIDVERTNWTAKLRYRVESPEGQFAQGMLRVEISYAPLILTGPGFEVVTDDRKLVVSGRTAINGSLTIDGTEVPTHAGSFSHTMLLPVEGVVEPTLVARAPEHLPRVLHLRFHRVASLQDEAERYGASPLPVYVELRRDTDAFIGVRVFFEARVFSLRVDQARSSLQVLAKECEESQGCPWWLDAPFVVELKEGAWVRAYGRVTGLQQFRADNGNLEQVPKLDVAYLLPL